MKNGVECYKDFFPYFKALKTNCVKFCLATKDFFGSHAQSPHLTEVRLWTELERVKNNSCGKNTDARSIEKGSLLSRSNSDLPLKPILGVMRKVRI